MFQKKIALLHKIFLFKETKSYDNEPLVCISTGQYAFHLHITKFHIISILFHFGKIETVQCFVFNPMGHVQGYLDHRQTMLIFNVPRNQKSVSSSISIANRKRTFPMKNHECKHKKSKRGLRVWCYIDYQEHQQTATSCKQSVQSIEDCV